MFAGQSADRLERFIDLNRIEAGGRFIENQNRRIGNEGIGETDPLPIPLGQCRKQTPSDFPHAAAFEAFLDAGRAPGMIDPFQFRTERQVFFNPHFAVQRYAFGQVADLPANLGRVVHDVVPGDGCRALRGGQVRREDAHDRRFAGAVRPEKADEFAGLD